MFGENIYEQHSYRLHAGGVCECSRSAARGEKRSGDKRLRDRSDVYLKAQSESRGEVGNRVRGTHLLKIATKLHGDYDAIAVKTTRRDAPRVSALRSFITFTRTDVKLQ